MRALIETQRLKKYFGGVRAVDGVDLVVPEGAIYALVGPNGAGKTTLLRTILGIYRADGGTAKILETESNALPPERLARIGYVSEGTKLPDWMQVGEYLAYLRPFYPTWDEEYCQQLLRQFAVPAERKLKELSKGMRMKAMLISALAYHPELMLLDEPFSGLDVAVRDEVTGALLDQAAPVTMVIASHDLAEMETFASHLAYLEGGKLRINEPLQSLTSRFRDVLLSVEGEAGPPWPESWLRVERSGGTLHYADSQWDDESEAKLAARYPGCRVEAQAMTLRQIFVALARSN